MFDNIYQFDSISHKEQRIQHWALFTSFIHSNKSLGIYFLYVHFCRSAFTRNSKTDTTQTQTKIQRIHSEIFWGKTKET